ncbi:MAG TPA: pyridoxamine 5'-phosphate oxidase [Acidothermaceae bacterium]|jgi:pyridoxamine 5'-phosphate oxidase
MDPDRIAALRAQYADIGLDEADLHADPMAQFERWLGEVIELGIPEPNAMVLSTADASGRPSSRHVLLKGVSPEGFVFFTNYGSRKGLELAANPNASLCFPWFCIGRQVIVTGSVSKVTEAETAAYFATRPRESQLGAWASARQSAVVSSRESLDDAYAAVRARFADAEVPPPPFWGGYRVRPDTVEFWQGRLARMHDRLRYRRVPVGDPPWLVERLSP